MNEVLPVCQCEIVPDAGDRGKKDGAPVSQIPGQPCSIEIACGLVEDQRVEAAMVRIKDALTSNASKEELQQRSLALARACRDSLAESWGVKQWRSPY